MAIGTVSAEDNSTLIGSGETHTFDELNDNMGWTFGGIDLLNDTYVGGSDPIQLTQFINLLTGGIDGEMATLDGKGTTYILKVPTGSNLLISNIYFINGNHAGGNGGAVYIEDGANVTFTNCKFIGNTAKNGGAIYGSNFTIIDCEFIDNTATDNGGAVYVNDGVTISTSTFSGNSAPNGGAVYASDAVEIKYSHFEENVAQIAGGAIASNNNVTVISSTFNSNSARNGGGGAISSKNLDVSHSSFNGNYAPYGGAISALADLNQIIIPIGSVADCMFIENNATEGPGADIYYAGELTVSDSSFASVNAQGGSNVFVPADGFLISEDNSFISNLDGTNGGSNVVVNVENIPDAENVNVYAYVPVGATGQVILALNTQKMETITITNGKSKYVSQISNIVYGLNDVVAKYSGDSNFVGGVQSVEFNKTHKKDISLNINAPAIDYGDIATIEITSSIDGPFEFTIGSEKQTITLENGKKTLTFENLNAGGYEVIVTYAGDGITNSKTVSEMLIVNKLESTLDVDVVTSDVSVTLKVQTNVESVIVYIDGEYFCELDTKSGSVSKILELPYLNEGSYVLNVVTNDNNYLVSEITQEFSTEYKCALYISEVESPVGNPGADLNVKILDRDGELFKEKLGVVITIVGEDFKDTKMPSASNGITDAIKLEDFKAGIYNVTAKFANPSKYGYSYATSQIILFDLIEAEEEKTVNLGEPFEYSVKIVNQENKPQPNTPVTFTIDGKNYTVTTDSNGIAKISLTLNTTGEHNITVSATFPQTTHGDPEPYEIKASIEVLPPELDSFKVTSAVTDKKATITATLGQSATGTVIFNVNGVNHTANINGKTAVLTLDDLENGQYRVIATLNSSQFKTIANTTTFKVNYNEKDVFIGANPIIISYGTQDNPFVVRVVDEDFTPLAGLDLVISINGTNYNKKTDAEGSATISTNRMDIGYYVVRVEFKGSGSYPATTVDSYIEILPVILSSLKVTAAVDLNDVEITAKLNQKVDNGVMVFYVGDRNYTQNVIDDTASLNVYGLEKGDYTVVAVFKSTDYSEISNSTTFTITGLRGAVNLSSNDVTMNYAENRELAIKATDDWNYVLEGIDLEIRIGNQTFHATTNDEGWAYVPLSKANGGDFIANITFAGNDDYNAANTTSHVVINPIEMGSIEINASVDYEHAVITVTFPNEVGSGELLFEVNGVNYSVPITGKTETLDLTNLEKGEYTALVKLNSPNYKEISSYVEFKVVKTRSPVNIAAANVTMSYGDDKYLKATLTDKNGNPIADAELIVKIAAMEIPATTDAEGTVSIPLNKLSGGNYSAVIKFNGSDTYAAALADTSITVNPIKMDSMTIKTEVDKQTATITVTLSQDVGAGNITLSVNGRNQVVPINGKTANITLNDLAEGNYDVKATLNSPNFEAITSSASFEISLSNPLLITVSSNDVYWTNTIAIYVKDSNNKAVSGVSLKITFNGATKSYKTSSTGRINLGTSELKIVNTSKPNVYDLKIVYDGAAYDYTSVNATVNVLSTIISDSFTKMYRNGTQFTAKLVDKNGKNLAEGTAITLNVNGENYIRNVKADGTIVVTIKLNPGVYGITVTNPSTGQVSRFDVTVLSNMEPLNFKDEFSIYYRNGTPFRLTLLDDHGDPIGPGVLVTMNINGVFYNRTTKDDGAISFTINLNPGKYILTAMRYADGHELMRSYTVNILSPIVAKSITMSASNRKPFTATILNGQGAYDVGNRVSLNINGIMYYRNVYQDANGLVSININLAPGIYIVTVYMPCRWTSDGTGNPYTLAQSFQIDIKNE